MKIYFRILAYGRTHFSNGVMALIFLFIFNIFNALSVVLLIPFLEVLFMTAGDLQKVITESLEKGGFQWFKGQFYAWIGTFSEGHDKQTLLVVICLLVATTILLKNFFRYLSSYNISPLEQAVIHNLRVRLFDHLSILSMSFYTGRKKGKIINVLITDVQIIQESVIGTLQTVISDPVNVLMILGLMWFISWKLTMFVFLVLPITAVLIMIISKSLKKKARRGQEKLGDLISVLDEFIAGIRIVKAFGAEKFEKAKYGKYNDHYRRLMISLKRRSDLASPLTEVFSILVLILIVLFGGSMVMRGELNPSEFLGMIGLFSQFLMPLRTLTNALARIQKGVASFQRVEEFLSIEEDVKESVNPVHIENFKESIRFEDVWFKYGEEDVLKGVSFEIKKGQVLALVGPSGAGKSTITDLLPRFYDPYKGKIFVDGIESKTLKVSELRGLFGVVTQEGILFNDSVVNNIAYGDPKPDKERVERAAKAANAFEFIQAMPGKFDSLIGERGTKLSGGQRQRLAIARAIYKDPPLLILDEATSSLDSESEKAVQDALDTLMKDRTAIVVAHWLSTITRADNILVIEKGQIIEEGNHEELIKKGGLYKRLFEIQFRDPM